MLAKFVIDYGLKATLRILPCGFKHTPVFLKIKSNYVSLQTPEFWIVELPPALSSNTVLLIIKCE